MPSYRGGDRAIATTQVYINNNTSGDTTLVAAPGAGKRLVICDIEIVNESSTATTTILKSGSTNLRRYLLQNQGNGVAMVFDAGREWRLGTNEAFVMNLSGANAHGGGLSYYIEEIE